MQIVERYSHLNGHEFLMVHKPALWTEVEDVVAAVDASLFRTKISKEKTMTGRQLYDPRALNDAIKDEFSKRDWTEDRADFFVTRDPKLIRKTLNLPPAEQKAQIEAAGERAVRSHNQTDFVNSSMVRVC